MAKKKCIVFLSKKFYNTYPVSQYPETEQKGNKTYIHVCVEIDGVQYRIPLKLDIHHSHVFWIDKANNCDVDFFKEVVIKEEAYIDSVKESHLRQNEFDEFGGEDYKIKIKKAKQNLSKPINQTLVKYSTL